MKLTKSPFAKLDEDERAAGTESEFIELLRQVFNSTEAKAAITSLVAQSNETRASPEDAAVTPKNLRPKSQDSHGDAEGTAPAEEGEQSAGGSESPCEPG